MKCRYCNGEMYRESETKINGYFEFYNCHSCKAVYERNVDSKYKRISNERWWNPALEDWDD
ncbi:hypothetical protein QA601_14285 [Chitinispirillales bacterium ANBcel5]|uniref:hypothetical protein n=1 Tax=Cellulosispirillum alkaliphilum TaxID=3039283 RepID=UPI002A58AB0F|nr:hypothetical protein [Chitinispirillales bacterium ANBcel5]